jgi:hypothetical protein
MDRHNANFEHGGDLTNGINADYELIQIRELGMIRGEY